MPNWHDDWATFKSNLNVRMAKGAEDYQDRSFSADPEYLVRQVQEELEDVAAWSFILWRRLETLLGNKAENKSNGC